MGEPPYRSRCPGSVAATHAPLRSLVSADGSEPNGSIEGLSNEAGRGRVDKYVTLELRISAQEANNYEAILFPVPQPAKGSLCT